MCAFVLLSGSRVSNLVESGLCLLLSLAETQFLNGPIHQFYLQRFYYVFSVALLRSCHLLLMYSVSLVVFPTVLEPK